MAEIFFTGQIVKAGDFPQSSITVKYRVITGDKESDGNKNNSNNNWVLVEGLTSGATQIDSSAETTNGQAIFAQPIELHYSVKSLRGWPKIIFEVYHIDDQNREILYGYGISHLPLTPGMHHSLECLIWRPTSMSLYERLSSYFWNIQSKLQDVDTALLHQDRYKLVTQSMGRIQMEMSVITRGFERFDLRM
ncbi:hypothetical protein MIR68_009906 [Amoeboaphelidium protococcarum]|nr:hypothetical protein MIR68_009906 [Amoeboaphelidium protococcarum]